MLQPSEQLSIASNTGRGSIGQASADRALEGKEQFLKLLVAQISNQNPMDPVDDKQMVSQLAQFSAIEQAIETNSKLESLEQTQAQAARMHLSTLVGKEAGASTANVMVTGDGTMPPPLAFSLEGPARDATLRILDKEGKLVRSIELGAQTAGPAQIAWDGRGQDRHQLLPGTYRLQVQARDMDGAEFSGRTEIRGTIGRVEMSDQHPAVYLGNVRVPVNQITSIHQ